MTYYLMRTYLIGTVLAALAPAAGLTLSGTACSEQAGAVRMVALEPTPLFPQVAPGAPHCQVAHPVAASLKRCNPCLGVLAGHRQYCGIFMVSPSFIEDRWA
jgi:hypothetical protein